MAHCLPGRGRSSTCSSTTGMSTKGRQSSRLSTVREKSAISSAILLSAALSRCATSCIRWMAITVIVTSKSSSREILIRQYRQQPLFKRSDVVRKGRLSRFRYKFMDGRKISLKIDSRTFEDSLDDLCKDISF